VRVFVNAVSVREGGPRVVLLKLLPAMQRERPDFRFCVAASPAMCRTLKNYGIECVPITVGQSPLQLLKWYECDLPAVARRWNGAALFSLTNYLPIHSISSPTLLLTQHAGHFSSVFERLLMQHPSTSQIERLTWRYKRAWVRRSCKQATVLTVQTAALAEAVARETGIDREGIRVIPHGPGWIEMLADSAPMRLSDGAFRIGYVSKFGVQKNFSTLFRAIRLLSDSGLRLALVLTLDPNAVGNAEVLAEAQALGIEDLIENRGEIASEELAALYDSLDVFVFPSLCESFGVPMVEAMARGCCIIVADTPENREIVGDAGLIYSALDAEELAGVLTELLTDENVRAVRRVASLKRANDFSWEKSAQATLRALEDAVAGFRG
jgi:glycosyltransferase involved in cell wall biosynthesis